MNRTIITNAHIITPESDFDGSVVVEEGRIAAVERGTFYPEGYDAGGQWLIPGIVDIHTDYLEKELRPRPSAEFPIEMAFHMMDQRALASGLTTILGAVRISSDRDPEEIRPLRARYGLALAEEYDRLARGALARHYMHVRWDTNFAPPDWVLDQLAAHPRLGNIVFNENIPGQRQFRSLEDIARKRANNEGIPLEQALERLRANIEANSKINNRALVQERFGGSVCIGSHDDTTEEHVVEAAAMGVTLAEMPTTIEAARKAKELGLAVCMGAPNYYRGGSHCGNLACSDALDEDLVDALCSDYHFPSLLGCVVKMIAAGVGPSRATNLVTRNAARIIGLGDDLGSIEVGKKADLALFAPHEGFGRVSEVWIDGVSKYAIRERELSLA